QADQVGHPVRHRVAEAAPPAGLVRLLDQLEEDPLVLRVVHAVHREQVGDVAFLEPDAAQLHAADLGFGTTDGVAGRLPRDAGFFTKPSQLRAQDHAAGRRAEILLATTTGRVHRVHEPDLPYRTSLTRRCAPATESTRLRRPRKEVTRFTA